MSRTGAPSADETAADIRRVVASLQDGGLAIFATETLWSLSCRADDPAAVQRVFDAKRRPEGVPLAVGFSSWDQARPYLQATSVADRLAKRFLPGPLSIVVRRRDDRLAHVAPDLPTLSVRVPDHPVAQAVLGAVGPCVMTSANRHGEADPTTRDQVTQAFPDVPVAGERVPGTGSTVVDATGTRVKVLRQGTVSEADLQGPAT